MLSFLITRVTWATLGEVVVVDQSLWVIKPNSDFGYTVYKMTKRTQVRKSHGYESSSTKHERECEPARFMP